MLKLASILSAALVVVLICLNSRRLGSGGSIGVAASVLTIGISEGRLVVAFRHCSFRSTGFAGDVTTVGAWGRNDNDDFLRNSIMMFPPTLTARVGIGSWQKSGFDWQSYGWAPLVDDKPVLTPPPRADTWYLSMPAWLAIAPFILLPILWLRQLWKRRKNRAKGRCAACGFDLRQSQDRCPECGEPILADQRTPLGFGGKLAIIGICSIAVYEAGRIYNTSWHETPAAYLISDELARIAAGLLAVLVVIGFVAIARHWGIVPSRLKNKRVEEIAAEAVGENGPTAPAEVRQ